MRAARFLPALLIAATCALAGGAIESMGAAGSALQGRLAYSTRAGDIWVVRADRSQKRRITTSRGGFDFRPTWSPDGTQIAFQTTRGARPPSGETNIFVVGADGRGERQLTLPDRFRFGGSSPAWAPHDGRIAFGSPHGLALVDSRTRKVTLLGVPGDCPAWSPDGTRLAYCAAAEAVTAPNQDVFQIELRRGRRFGSHATGRTTFPPPGRRTDRGSSSSPVARRAAMSSSSVATAQA